MSELDGFEVMPYINQRTNKGKIAARDKRIEQLEGEIGGTRTISIPSLALNYVDNRLESIGMGGELYVRQRVLESYGQVPELGERSETGERESYSRWHELFGTPERAAEYFAMQCFGSDGGMCYYCPFDDCDERLCNMGAYPSVYDKLLGWLRGDA